MPLSYAHYRHGKLATEDEIEECEKIIKTIYPVIYLGQDIKMPHSQVSNIADRIYTQNYSPISSVINPKKMHMTVDEGGINIDDPKKSGSTSRFNLHELVFVSNDLKHTRMVVILTNKPQEIVRVYLCNNATAAKSLVVECGKFKTGSGVDQIEYLSSPNMVKLNHASNTENNLPNDATEHNFGGGANENVNREEIKVLDKTKKCGNQTYNLLKFDENVDEEFMQLSRKRDVHDLDLKHLQNETNYDSREKAKSIFSSYKKLPEQGDLLHF